MINLRGKILSVVDLKKFFHLPEHGLGDLNRVIVLHHQTMEFGILADELLGLWTLHREAVRPGPVTIGGLGAEYLMGVTDTRQIILDARKILDDQNIVVDQETP